MIKKLITWQQFVDKFKPEASTWKSHFNIMFPHNKCILHVEWKDYTWGITDTSKELFGTVVEVIEKKGECFTHVDINGRFLFHESWFEPDDFFSEEEFEI